MILATDEDTKVKDAVALRFKELCEERNISPNALAVRSGVTPSTVYSMLDSSQQSVTVPTVKKLCDGLGITLVDFLTPRFSLQSIVNLRLPDGETRRKGARTTKNLWVSKLHCRCGSSYRIFNWRKLKDGTPVFEEERIDLMAVSEKPILTFTIDFETAKRYRKANSPTSSAVQRGPT